MLKFLKCGTIYITEDDSGSKHWNPGRLAKGAQHHGYKNKGETAETRSTRYSCTEEPTMEKYFLILNDQTMIVIETTSLEEAKRFAILMKAKVAKVKH